MTSITVCPCCGNEEFYQNKVLWPSLVKEWRLNKQEHLLVDRQQGFACTRCFSNLRSMSLARAITETYGHKGTLASFAKKQRSLRVLEINTAGSLTQFLSHMRKHTLLEYPDIDIMDIGIADNSYDLVVHSDTLEHIPNPILALRECRRILKPGGHLIYTVPSVVGRLTKRRSSKDEKSFHGVSGDNKDDYVVYTEYGDNLWNEAFEAGFGNCTLVSIDYPASVAVCARK